MITSEASENYREEFSDTDPKVQDLESDIRQFLDDNGLQREEIMIEIVYDSTEDVPLVSYELRTEEQVLREMSCAQDYRFDETDREFFEEMIWPEVREYIAEDAFKDSDTSMVEISEEGLEEERRY